MWRSGYDRKSREEILLAGIKGFKRLEELESKGIRSINRSRQENFEARLLNRFGAKKNWYRGKKKEVGGERRSNEGCGKRGSWKVWTGKEHGKSVEAVMFIPPTLGGELTGILRENDDKNGGWNIIIYKQHMSAWVT